MKNKSLSIPLAIIGGSGAHSLLSKNIIGKPKIITGIKTPFGKTANLYSYKSKGLEFLFLPRHGSDGYKTSAPFVNYRANIWGLKELGVQRIIAWSGPGVINPTFEVGHYAVPHDVLDVTKNRPSTFFEKGGLGFIRMSHPFCPDMRHAIIYALNQFGCPHYDESIYCCTEGPRLETPAEINLYHSYGADLVGMTLAPEVFLARELEMCYAAVCYLTNFAEGLATRDYKSGVLFEGMMTDKEKVAVDSSLGKIPSIVTSAFQAIVNHDRECDCKNAMLRYRERGDIKDDWRTWIDP